MSDPRLTPANGRVAAAHLRGLVEAERFSDGTARQVAVPVADLLNAPGGRRERQLLRGQGVTVYDSHDGWSFVQSERDGYVGYLQDAWLVEETALTHWVSARATHIYPEPDFKTRESASLSHLSRTRVLAQDGRFSETSEGYIPSAHLTPLERHAEDPVTVAELYLGAPYLWGGNSAFGLDCSGLVQAGCLACGIPCPGDSDLQQAGLGTELADDARLRRGDLLFWKGHVAWVVDEARLLHANAYHMAVAYEPIDDAIARIKSQGDGPVTSRKRLGGTP